MSTPDPNSNATATPSAAAPTPAAAHEFSSSRLDYRKFSLEKLVDDGSSNTYGEWVGVAKSKLQLLRLWKYITGPESSPPTIPRLIKDARFQAVEESSGQRKWFVQKGNKDDVEEATKKAEPWFEGNLAARTILLEALPSEKRSLISDADSAKFIWDFLAEEYRPMNFARTQVQFQDIMKFTCAPGMDVTKWANQLRQMYVNLRAHSPNRIKDTDFAVTIANLLPATPAWSEFGARLFDTLNAAMEKSAPLSSARVFSMIRDHDWNKKKSDPEVLAEAYNVDALYVGGKRPGTPTVNHMAAPAKKSKNEDWCENKLCPRPRGHTKFNCVAYGGDKCGQYPEGWRGRTDLHLPPNQRSQGGTFKNKSKTFTKSQPRANNAAATAPAKAECNHTSHSSGNDDEDEVVAALCQEGEYYAFNLITEPDPASAVTCNTIALVPSNVKARDDVYHDSGANRHIFYDRSVFTNYRSITPLTVKGFGSSLATSAVGVGDVYLRTTVKGTVSTMKLSDALHVPSARLNLVSQGCLERRGVCSATGNGSLVLSLAGKTIATGKIQQNDLFRLHVKPIPRELSNRLDAPRVPLAQRITVPLIDRISPLGATSTASKQKPRTVTSGFCTA